MLQPNSSRPEATLLSPLVILSWRESHCPAPQGECWRPILERCCSCAEQMDGQMDGQRGRWMDRGADDTRQTTLGQQHSGNRCWHGLDLAHSFPRLFQWWHLPLSMQCHCWDLVTTSLRVFWPSAGNYEV